MLAFGKRKMKHPGILKKIYTLALLAMALQAAPGWADAIGDRMLYNLDYRIDHPGSNPATDEKGDIALATLYLWDSAVYPPTQAQKEKALAFIDDLCNLQNPLPTSGSNSAVKVWFQLPMLARMYLDPDLSLHLTAQNKANIVRVLWQFNNPRARLSDARRSVWENWWCGENKKMTEHATFLLGSKALQAAGCPYGTAYADGGTIDAHVKAWTKRYYEHFRQIAREGLMCEIGSQYNATTIGYWCTVRDMMAGSEPELSVLIDKALTLFWADYACDFLAPTGQRGIAESRHYKDSIDVLEGTWDKLRDMSYCYGWHENWLKLSARSSQVMICPYRPPANVRNIALNMNRPSYLSASRKFGRNAGDNSIIFGPQHSSDILRNVWWTPNYVLGGITYRRDGAVTYFNAGGPSNNIAFGLIPSNAANPNEAIVFYGSQEPSGEDDSQPSPGWQQLDEISSVCGKRCLVAGMSPQSQSKWVKLFISKGNFENNRVDQGGWVFTKTTGLQKEVFVGIKICQGGYTTITLHQSGAVTGNALCFTSSTAPVVVEAASGAEYPGASGFNDFMNACRTNWTQHAFRHGPPAYDPAANKVDYTSLAGDRYEFWSNSTTAPRKNGAVINLNPTRTYNSPYVKGDHGSDLVTIGDGATTSTLDFNYANAPQWDDYQTKALWHMDNMGTGKVADDDLEASARNNDLTVSGAVIDTNNDVNTLLGDCLYFDGVDDMATAVYSAAGPKGWAAYPTVKIDFWIKPQEAAASDRTIVAAASTWEFRQRGSDLVLRVWYPGCGSSPHTLTAPGGATPSVWRHVTGTVSANGGASLMTLKVGDLPLVTRSGAAMSLNSADINVGGKPGAASWFKGWIDDVKIRVCNVSSSLPAKATTPTPTDKGVRTGAQPLTWLPAESATAYDLYLWKSGQPVPQTPTSTAQTATSFNPGLQGPGVTYCWRVDSRNDLGVTQGVVWSFSKPIQSRAAHWLCYE